MSASDGVDKYEHCPFRLDMMGFDWTTYCWLGVVRVKTSVALLNQFWASITIGETLGGVTK
jgi:hypothetical protein